jgi:hypothetical protein
MIVFTQRLKKKPINIWVEMYESDRDTHIDFRIRLVLRRGTIQKGFFCVSNVYFLYNRKAMVITQLWWFYIHQSFF